MSADMNCVALQGGYLPFGGTFLTFSDYSRNAIRMASLMKQRVVHVFTHDSIGLGEDGPTHQYLAIIGDAHLCVLERRADRVHFQPRPWPVATYDWPSLGLAIALAQRKPERLAEDTNYGIKRRATQTQYLD